MDNLPQVSVVVLFHEMRREAERTLFSLTPQYQGLVSDHAYEVIAVERTDNNSPGTLSKEFVRSFGPQFRYLKIFHEFPSPCRPMNLGVADARGRIVLCLIDGARILSPGILRKVLEVFSLYPNPFAFTLGMHLGQKVQNESILEGYNQLVEDRMLDKTKWKENGYELFSISSIALSSKEGYFSRLSESNCFALYKNTYESLGGFDERFSSPGGGLANLDFFNRVMEADITPVMLMSEATFHQIHGGVATNVPLKEHPWKKFAEEYRKIHGKEYSTVYKEPQYYGKIIPEVSHLLKKA